MENQIIQLMIMLDLCLIHAHIISHVFFSMTREDSLKSLFFNTYGAGSR